MAKPTRLRVMDERFPEGVGEEGSPLAATMEEPRSANFLSENSPEDGERILAALRAQLAEKDRETREAKAHAANAERQITQAYDEAKQAVRKVEERRGAAEERAARAEVQSQQRSSYFATIGLNILQRFFDRMTWFIAFLLTKLPTLAALYGGFALWQQVLPAPTTLSLIALGLYGGLIVLPCVWLASRPPSTQEH